MTEATLEEIKNITEEFAQKIDAPDDLLPTFGKYEREAHPYITVDDDGTMAFIVSERGNELERKTTVELDELLYWIFSDITFSLALDYELKHRKSNKDNRRVMFERQEELLGILSTAWEDRAAEEHHSILLEHPFDDNALLRAEYCEKLRSKGISESEITRMAYEKYPEVK